MTTQSYETFIQKFITAHARGFFPDERDDLHQDIFVALLEEDPNGDYAEFQVNLTAQRVLQEFRNSRFIDRKSGLTRLRIEDFREDDNYSKFLHDPHTPNLDIRLDVERAIKRLPDKLQDIVEDFFYRGLTQEAVAEKHGKTQAWASKTKSKIQKLLSNSL